MVGEAEIQRETGEIHLVDLETDPQELYDVAPVRPDVVERHVRRARALAEALTSSREMPEALSAEDEARLRALGYLE